MQTQLQLPLCHESAQRPQVPFFQPLVCAEGGTSRYLPDDYAFCERARRRGYGNAWMGNAFETTTLTRFIGSDAKRKFQWQTARNFRRPAEQGDEAPAAKKSKRKPRVAG
jgi:hypothetical protein